MEPASSVKLSQVDSYLNDYPEISQERKCHIASYKLFKVSLGSVIFQRVTLRTTRAINVREYG